MDKALADRLRHIQSHPTTGTAHNEQLISTQVETIFAIDRLDQQIEKLIKTIESNEQQNQKLERSNINLQKTMLILTFITTIIAAFPLFLLVFNNLISPALSSLFNFPIPITISIFIATIFSIAISLFASRHQKEFFEVIKMTDSIDMVVRDKDGNIKDTRHY